MANGFGCWLKGKEVFELKTTHIQFIIDNPDKFNITLDEIKSIYERYGEVIGTEQTAREVIIKKVVHAGKWIRVREYLGKTAGTYWSIQCDEFECRKDDILHFCETAIKQHKMNKYDEIRILSFNSNTMIVFPFQKGGVSKLLEEQCKS